MTVCLVKKFNADKTKQATLGLLYLPILLTTIDSFKNFYNNDDSSGAA